MKNRITSSFLNQFNTLADVPTPWKTKKNKITYQEYLDDIEKCKYVVSSEKTL